MSAWLVLPQDPQQDEVPLAGDQCGPCIQVQIPEDLPSQVHPCVLFLRVPPKLPLAMELPLQRAPSTPVPAWPQRGQRLQRRLKKNLKKKADYAKINWEKQGPWRQLRHSGREQTPSAQVPDLTTMQVTGTHPRDITVGTAQGRTEAPETLYLSPRAPCSRAPMPSVPREGLCPAQRWLLSTAGAPVTPRTLTCHRHSPARARGQCWQLLPGAGSRGEDSAQPFVLSIKYLWFLTPPPAPGSSGIHPTLPQRVLDRETEACGKRELGLSASLR